jgi:hypothetical protein
MINSIQSVSVASMLFNLLMTTLAFYSAWKNLAQKQITTFGPDAFVVFLAHLITKKRMETLRKDHNLPIRMGIAMIILGLSFLRIVIMYFTQK